MKTGVPKAGILKAGLKPKRLPVCILQYYTLTLFVTLF